MLWNMFVVLFPRQWLVLSDDHDYYNLLNPEWIFFHLQDSGNAKRKGFHRSVILLDTQFYLFFTTLRSSFSELILLWCSLNSKVDPEKQIRSCIEGFLPFSFLLNFTRDYPWGKWSKSTTFILLLLQFRKYWNWTKWK